MSIDADGKINSMLLGTHTHALVVVHDTSALDADLDTALATWLLEKGIFVTLADPADVAGNLAVDGFDFIIVSASCVAADVGNLANLRIVETPVICHSAAIAASAVFDLGGTPHTEAAQTQIEITNNTCCWLLSLATGDTTVTASANIDAMNTKCTAAVTLAEEATGTGNHLTIVMLRAGEENGAATPYTAFFDRFFIGVGDYTNMTAFWKSIMEGVIHHLVHEKRYQEEVVQVKGVFQEQAQVDVDLDAIDTVLTNPPPSADAENSVVDLDEKNRTVYCLRGLWVNIISFGTGTQLTFQLWVVLNGTVTSVDSVVVNTTGFQNLMDIFGLPEVTNEGIWITAITDVGTTGDIEASYNYAQAKR